MSTILPFAAPRDGRPRVLALMDYYLPGHKAGGPLRSISNLVESLGGEFDFWIIARDRDSGDAGPYCGVRVGEWQSLGRGQVLYTPPGWRSAWMVARLLRSQQFDLVYLNSFFSRCFSMLPVWLAAMGLLPRHRILLAPRGEFAAGALSLKPWRKRLYLRLIHYLGIYRAVIWHASSNLEASEILRIIGRDTRVRRALPLTRPHGRFPKVITALDMPMSAGTTVSSLRTPKRANHLDVVFLSRISPSKNLHGALDILAGVDGDLDFHVYGPIEDQAYWDRCRHRAESFPAYVRFHYHGAVAHEQVPTVLARHDLFFLPTLGENYGHVILEALLAGCPLLLSERTPWRNLEEIGVGWDLPLDCPDLFRKRLEACVRMPGADFAGYSENARHYGWGRATDKSVLEDNRQLLLKSLEEAVCASV